MSMKGKAFEAEISKALKVFSKHRAFAYRNSNEGKPICDHLAWWKGQAYLLEEKEVRQDSFYFSRLTKAERDHLDQLYTAGVDCWILIKWIDGNRSRAFACDWSEWLSMEEGFGYNPLLKRNKPGSCSFKLADQFRPMCFIELPRLYRSDSFGGRLDPCWDLSPIFEGGESEESEAC